MSLDPLKTYQYSYFFALLRGFALLPYVKGTTEKIQRVLRSHQIKTAVKPASTLRQILSKPKDPIPTEKKTGVIYQIPCKEYNAVYIGETKRSLKTRQKEHMDSVRLDKAERSALAEHTSLTGRDVGWSNTKIIGQEIIFEVNIVKSLFDIV